MNIALPDKGRRVWTIDGLNQHGPLNGSKTYVPANTGGTITGTEQPYLTMDQVLYVVKWDSGQQTKHYFKELFVIGDTTTLDELDTALRHGENAVNCRAAGWFSRIFDEPEQLDCDTSIQGAKVYMALVRTGTTEARVKIEIEKLPAKPRQPRQ